MTIETIVLFILAYLIGSIQFGVIFSKLIAGVDVTSVGSKNTGATNALRAGGKLVGFLTLMCDLLKGFIPVKAVMIAFPTDTYFHIYTALGCFIGHLYPFYLRFRGGKGVATFLGILLALRIGLFTAIVGVMILVVYTTRYVSLASIAAAVTAFMFGIILCPIEESYLLLVLGFMIILRHRQNINNLIKNQENKLKL